MQCQIFFQKKSRPGRSRTGFFYIVYFGLTIGDIIAVYIAWDFTARKDIVNYKYGIHNIHSSVTIDIT